MRSIAGFCICLGMTMVGCGPASRTMQIVKTDHPTAIPYNRIIVIAITPDDSVRSTLETGLVKELKQLGYSSESSLFFFGKGGLSNLGEEGTYLKFCDEGVDAILVLSRIHRKDAALPAKMRDQLSLNSYYYNRIWQYPRLRAEEAPNTVWESVFFDLVTLSPHFVGQNRGRVKANDLARNIVKAMLESEVLSDQHERIPSGRKAF